MVPFFDLTRQYAGIKDQIRSAMDRVFEKGRFVLGEEVSAFEEEFARYCGVRYGVGVDCGTNGLYLALKAAGIGEGDEVITVSHSFIATALAINRTGARPLFVEIDPKSFTMDPNTVELLLKKQKQGKQRIKAILPVHLYGHPAEMDGILEIADRFGLVVIEDACQAHGSEYRGGRVGSFGLLGCFSFYPTKNLGAYGDGGMIVTNDKKAYEKLRLLRCYGEKRRYSHTIKGDNSRLDEIQAAVLRVKLSHLDRWNDRRREIAADYRRLLQDADVLCPTEKQEARHVYHLFVIRTKRRNRLQAFLRDRGIDTLIHYPVPIHLQKAFRNSGYLRGDLPLTETCAREILSLPFFPELTGPELEAVAGAIRVWLEQEGTKHHAVSRK